MDAGYYSSEINIIRDACSLNDICGWYRQGQILWDSGNTVETVVLMSKQRNKDQLPGRDGEIRQLNSLRVYGQSEVRAYGLCRS